MSQPPPPRRADVLITGGRLIDPANHVDAVNDIAITDGRVTAIGAEAAATAPRQTINAAGAIVVPGLIDMHVHCYEWVTNFGLPPDAAGIHSGATTIVDQGSSGAWTFGGFKAYITDVAKTDVRAFVSINVAGALQGGMEGTTLHNPRMIDFDAFAAIATQHPRLVRGIKCHGESGGFSHWGTEVLGRAAECGRALGLPLYVHTGELFPVDETARPSPSSVMAQVLPFLKKGDVLAHVYSNMPDGIMSIGESVPTWLHEARSAGVLFDLGHGINFSFAIARKMLEAGIMPDTLGSDVHGDFCAYHDFSILDYSLIGGFNKMLALGVSLPDTVRALSATPARVLDDPTIGHLGVGARANITMLREVAGDWCFQDCRGERLTAQKRILPDMVLRDGCMITPDCGLLADVMSPAERPRGITRSLSLGGHRASPAAP